MTNEHCREMQLLIQADFDGELSSAEAARVAAHLLECPECEALREELSLISTAVRMAGPRYRAPDRLRASIQELVAAQTLPDRRPFGDRSLRRWRAGASFGGGFALAACLALALVLPQAGDGLADAVVSDHIRSLQPGHLMDVVSTDRHTVKPWFDGRLPFAPVVKDFKTEGYPLIGGRLDYLDGREVAALVYARGKHVIQLFVWPDDGGRNRGVTKGGRNGYHTLHWNRDGMTYWAVSDVNTAELDGFVRLWRGA